ncbi:MAG: restriction endonuclease subunit R [Thermonema sp.]|jgi:type I site-specific restriction endonuclease|uniref:type I restriction enzyme HsdR N-terminal domain-containing protein n=1 Tax=Thermonema TaxID=28194 RepID=UPI000570A121|nr:MULTISPECIES: type I restriction enzyme HsdR N-terminal domain-containing protein [Thermonema]GIV40572.1 MAG: restriction endonuclease subunit R [Thermonema sp.]
MQTSIPHYRHRIRKGPAGALYIFDTIRKKWVRLLPEEWVRQQFIRWLIEEQHYPAALIAVEQSLGKWRADIVVYDRRGMPFLVVECKRHAITLSRDTLMQVLRYNALLKAPYWAITNGEEVHLFSVNPEKQAMEALDAFPPFPS